jgi:L-arabinose transport system substrate-binding protein
MLPRRRALAFLVAAYAALAACGRDATAPVKLGFLVKQPEEPWFQLEWRFAEEAQRELGFTLVKIAARDGESTLAAIDNLAAQGAAGFVICTPDPRLGPAIVARAQAHDLRIVSVDDRFVDASGAPLAQVPYVGISARKIGEQVGEALWDEMQRRRWPLERTGLCAITFDELETARERTEGAVAALTARGFPAAQIHRGAETAAEIPAALAAADVVLTRQPDVERWLVCSMNDNSVLGAVRALEGRGFGAERVIAIGINGTDCIDELAKSAPTGFHGSMLLSAREHGKASIAMLHRWVKDGVEPPAETRTIGTLITRENFERVLAEHGIARQ